MSPPDAQPQPEMQMTENPVQVMLRYHGNGKNTIKGISQAVAQLEWETFTGRKFDSISEE